MDIFETLCNFSYKGDIRMRWKFENANKVKNIVEGSYDGLLEEYLPLLKQYEEEGLIHLITEKDKDVPSAVWFRHSRENL